MKLALSFGLFAIALVQMAAAAPIADNSVEQDLESRAILFYNFSWKYKNEDSPDVEVTDVK
ncbi:uncharacterized protein EDB91DRAFT_1255895 [Suillus paluster]|uniref:uncharacterized protein n=1 Tax=Suillus paluster TaxID=48578 RepID=UPI001B871BA2|nr:uncharacterized protein EDB91DRAFT_1255895 [Suillus paluster]KAG1722843.1 hypothetical protein EDB91DRAFT_1255895 [Suillus paluster]